MAKISGGKIAAQAIIDRGVEEIFTLSGGHITPIYQFLEGTSVKLYDTRHEQSAVFMAEAYGRMTKKPGVAMVTAGPGFTNTLSAIANAKMANSPLLLISGSVGVECIEKLDLQDITQAPVIEPMVKKAFVCHNPERIAEFFDMAYRTTTAGRPGPVYLELPVDILNAEVEEEAVRKPNTAVESNPYDPEKAKEIIAMIKAAEKPVIIAGSGAWYSGAEKELSEFALKSNVPVFTSALGRGVLSDEHPLCFEGSIPIRPGGAFMGLASADLVILLGTRISLYYLFGDIFPADAKIIQVDIMPEELGRNRTIDLPVHSDIKGIIGECLGLLDIDGTGAGMKEKFASWVEMLKGFDADGKSQSTADWEKTEMPIHPMRLAKEVNDFMSNEDDIIVADGGDTQVWMGMTRTIRKPGHYLDSGLYGCLGVGLPYANAAKYIYPDKRVCLLTGDGSTGFNFMEFETAIRKNAQIVVVISNDLGWGMIRHSQELRLGHAIEDGTFIGKVDYHKMVEAIGGKGMYVEKPEDIKPALEEAFASGKTVCINVMTDPTTVSPGSVALASLGSYKA